MDRIRERVNQLFSYGEQVTAAVSGGVDSMVLLDSLLNCGLNLNIKVAHFNHLLRGQDSFNDAQFVKEYCDKNNIPFYIKQADIKEISIKSKVSIEMAGRIERYKFFESFGGRVATAHNLSDRIETMVFNLIRGTAHKGLASIMAYRGKFIRPILEFTKGEIISYAQGFSVEYVEDKTNKDNYYTRNYIRNEIMPLFYNINKKYEKNIENTMNLIKEDNDYLDKIALNVFNNSKSGKSYKLEIIKNQDDVISKRVIKLILKEHAIAIDSITINRVFRIIKFSNGRASLQNDKSAAIRRGDLYIDQNTLNKPIYLEFNGEKLSLNNYMFIKELNTSIDEIRKKYKNDFIFILNYDIINGNLVLRNKMEGDKIKLDKRPTKTLKKLFSESGFSPNQKSQVLVLTDDKGPLWVSEFGSDVRCMNYKNAINFIVILKK